MASPITLCFMISQHKYSISKGKILVYKMDLRFFFNLLLNVTNVDSVLTVLSDIVELRPLWGPHIRDPAYEIFTL